MDYSQFPDESLTLLIRDGDELAFKEVYNRYDVLLYLYAYKKLQNKDDAQDAVQEVFISLWNNRASFAIQTTLAGYLYKSVLNRVLNIFKHNNIVQKYINSKHLFIEIDSAGTDFLIREKEIAALIEKEIAGMPPRMRQIYELKRKEFLSTKEIAVLLDISEQTVSTQMKRALRLLRLRLGIVVYILYIINS